MKFATPHPPYWVKNSISYVRCWRFVRFGEIQWPGDHTYTTFWNPENGAHEETEGTRIRTYGGESDGFENKWGIWTELKLASRCSKNIWIQYRVAKTGQDIMKMFTCFTTEDLFLSLKLSWKKNHSLRMWESSESKKLSNLVIFCPAAAARCSLQSLPTDSLMPYSVTRRPSINFKTLMALFIGSGSGSSVS